ncbi:MAG: hypothetical protein FJX54_06270 [Alphaproteobacteria bacterium]|nr:hypothetical protein [Alphaproteobacteria bacterium]
MAEGRESYDVGSVVWRTPAGGIVSCVEKLKVMSQNFRELQLLAKDALEDAVLMGCEEAQVRAELVRMIESLESGYRR